MAFRRTGLVLQNESGAIITDEYEFSDHSLGEGSYGSVRRGVEKRTGIERAIKTIPKDRVKYIPRFHQEIRLMKELEHPNIIRLFETYEDEMNIYLVMELCTGGELFDRIISVGSFSEKDAAVYVKQMLSAVLYLHNHGICHRDLKPENFLLASPGAEAQLKLIDFGLSARFTPGVPMHTKSGTPYYCAPEILNGAYTEACDIWSIGVLAYVLLCGYPPFNGRTDKDILISVKRGYYEFPGCDWNVISSLAKDFVSKLLQFNPHNRLTASEAIDHEWLKLCPTSPSNRNLVFDKATQNKVLNGLRSFRSVSKLKKVALTAIAHQLNDNEVDELKEIFQSMDTNGDGTLTIDEIKNGLSKAGVLIPGDFDEFLKDIDLDGNGTIDYMEFIAATMDKRLYQQRDVCWRAFKIFDRDNSGKISIAEFLAVLEDGHCIEESTGFNAESIKQMIHQYDLNNDGEIDFDEFVAMIGSNDK